MSNSIKYDTCLFWITINKERLLPKQPLGFIKPPTRRLLQNPPLDMSMYKKLCMLISKTCLNMSVGFIYGFDLRSRWLSRSNYCEQKNNGTRGSMALRNRRTARSNDLNGPWLGYLVDDTLRLKKNYKQRETSCIRFSVLCPGDNGESLL